MKNSIRHEITSKYRAGMISKSNDNQVVDVSNSMLHYLAALPEYVAPPATNRKEVFDVSSVFKRIKLR